VECRDQIVDIFRIQPIGKRADQFADKYRQLALFEIIDVRRSCRVPSTAGRGKCFNDGRRGMLRLEAVRLWRVGRSSASDF
jgi:hypothetical protein